MSPPATDDPFDALGLPHTFRLDAGRIRSAHVRLLASLHPDRAASPVEAADLARRAAAVNAAERALADPLARGRALLARLGGQPVERMPPSFLAETMELRESLDEALAGGDVDGIAAARADAQERREAELEAIASAFDEAFAAAPGSPARADAAGRAAESLARLRYVTRLIERCDDPAGMDGG